MASKALLLLCVLAIAANSVAAKKATFSLLLVYKAGDRVETPGYSDKVTSYRTWAGAVYAPYGKTYKPVGFVDGLTTVLKVRPTYKVFLANFVYDFGTYQISTNGDTVTDRAVNTISITGGTGKYKRASGTATVVEVPKKVIKGSVAEYKVTFEIYY